MQQFKTYEHYHNTNLLPVPIFLEDNIYSNELLKQDLNKITLKNLKEFYKEDSKKLEILNNKINENEINKMKINYLSKNITEEIAKERVKLLSLNIKPYDSINLKGLSVDKDNLVSINDLEQGYGCFIYNEKPYVLCYAITDSNSNKWITDKIIKINKKNNIEFRIRLDPLVTNYVPLILKMDVYGKKLKWKELSNINEEIAVLKIDEDGIKTEIVWQKINEKLHFKCEELPLFENIKMRGSRFFHAIYDPKINKIIHCDGSTKIYDEHDFLKRNDTHIKDSNTKNLGNYRKIFKADGEISTENFTELITSFFVRNYDISNYLKELNDKI